MMRFQKVIFSFILILLPVLSQAQCAMCKAVLESSGNKAQAEGINHGIIYLMLWPYLLIAGVGFAIWWTMRKQGQKTA